MLVLSLTVSVVLAAFTANKSGAVILSFANGLTIKLEPIDSNAAIHIETSNASQSGQFAFTSDEFANLSDTTTVNGIKATLYNQNGYVGYKVELKELINNAESTIDGSWTNSSGTVTFTPNQSGAKKDWRAILVVNTTSFPTIACSGQSMTAKSSAALTKEGSGYNMFTSITFDGATAHLMDDLAGRKMKLLFTINADTAGVVSFN